MILAVKTKNLKYRYGIIAHNNELIFNIFYNFYFEMLYIYRYFEWKCRKFEPKTFFEPLHDQKFIVKFIVKGHFEVKLVLLETGYHSTRQEFQNVSFKKKKFKIFGRFFNCHISKKDCDTMTHFRDDQRIFDFSTESCRKQT